MPSQIRNALVLLVGGALILLVARVPLQLSRVFDASRTLSSAMSEQPYDSEHAAVDAYHVLKQYPRSTRAFVVTVCRAWNAGFYDDVARLMQWWLPHGAIPSDYDDCTSRNPISRALNVMAPDGDVRSGLVVVNVGVEGGVARPTLEDIDELAPDARAQYLAVVCRNAKSGLAMLADWQMGTYREEVGTPDEVLAGLPASWGCREVSGIGQ